MTRVVITVRGGIIWEVLSDNPCKVIILDYDTEGRQSVKEHMLDHDGVQAYVRIEDALATGTPQRTMLMRKMLHDQGFNNA